MNDINILGNISTELELKKTSTGKSVMNFNVAVKRNFSDITDFFTVVVWNKTAEIIAEYFHKGDKIAISGELTTRKYEDSNGNNRVAYEIVANSFDFCNGRKNTSDSPAPTPAQNFEVIPNVDDIPF